MIRLPRSSARLLLTASVIVAGASARGVVAADLPKLTTEVAFPNLKFNRPVALAYPNDGSNLLFVNEQHEGTIQSFPNDPETSDKQVFLTLPDKLSKDNEEGLLGLAFHPKYKENGLFYVYYSAAEGPSGRRSVVARFRVSKDNPRKADPSSEKRIWVAAPDPFGNHNGGCIAFGPDGYLYVSLGDGGAADDPMSSGQNPRDWFGSIMCLDVDHPADGKPYGIPATNPAARSKKHAHWAPEVYAIGLRNVWKFTFDRQTGELWAGDVGQNLWEMVHLIKSGGNYGWSIKEAFHPFQPQRRQKADPASKISPPIVEYPHAPNLENSGRLDDGKSITGGYVYRGKRLPELSGVYVYGDFDTGRIWGLRHEGGKLVASGEIVDVTKSPRLDIAAFGEDQNGEILILSLLKDGKIHRFAAAK